MKYALRGASLLLIVFCGCGKKLDMEFTFDLPIEGKSYVIEPGKKEQKVKVSATATVAPMNVFLFLEKDRDSVEKDVLRNRYPETILAHDLKTDQANLEATIPANTPAMVLVTRAGTKASNVKLKITNGH